MQIIEYYHLNRKQLRNLTYICVRFKFYRNDNIHQVLFICSFILPLLLQ